MYTFKQTIRPQVESHLRRIVDLTVPNFNRELSEQRGDSRSNRVIPVLVCPWVSDRPMTERSFFALTKDVASDSAGIVMPQPLTSDEVVVCFWLGADVMDEPWYFLGLAQAQREYGGGFWTVGVQFTDLLTQTARDRCGCLAPLAAQLPPPQPE